MEFSLLCTRVNALALLVALCSKFIQSPMEFAPMRTLQTTTRASSDFGGIIFNSPSLVLRPQSPMEVSLLLTSLSASPWISSSSSSSSSSHITVAARGAGHSIHGQAQALDGIVIEMDSIPPTIKITNRRDGDGDVTASYADVSAGVLWVELLEESLKVGLAPRSWTDYLYLSIGGTLSNGGISGQAFKHGPQISNVLQLDVVTGRGELVVCSPIKNPELFYAVLGGLGQFGIITKARILLQDAPQKVKWVRAFYDDFSTFIKDQELLVSMPEMVDYVEGFVVLNEQSLHSSSIAFSSQLGFIPELHKATSKLFYCIEFAVHDYQANGSNAEQIVGEMTSRMNYMAPFIYMTEVSYFDFLNRVRMEEVSLRGRGLWDIPHPWLNMFVPKSGITEFKDFLLGSISPNEFVGLILIYPLLKDKWDANSSAVLPDDDADSGNVVFVVGVLRSADPRSCPSQCLKELLSLNERVAKAGTGSGAKQYLAHHRSPEGWAEHFGQRWQRFAARKSQFDPFNVLAPGQGIFPRIHNAAL